MWNVCLMKEMVEQDRLMGFCQHTNLSLCGKKHALQELLTLTWFTHMFFQVHEFIVQKECILVKFTTDCQKFCQRRFKSHLGRLFKKK